MGVMQDLTVIESLSIVVIRGFKETPEDELAGTIDPLGSANYFCNSYGMAEDKVVPPGILWADYEPDGSVWNFAVLIDTDEVERLQATAVKDGYEVVKVETVTEPAYFGDGNGTVAILKHPDGWVVLS